MVIDLNVRRNQPQCSNFALNVRTHQSHCGSCRSKGGRCRGTDGNSPYIFSAEKCTFIIKYSKVWKWCRTFNANFFDLNVRHLTYLRSFCVEHSGQLPAELDPQHPDHPVSVVGEGWAEWGTLFVVPKAGCYVVEVSWAAGHWSVTFAAGA